MMPAAARTGDSTAHGRAPSGVLGPPPPAAAARVATVLIGGRPAAVVGTMNQCAVPPQHAALGPANVVLPDPPRPGGLVLIGGLPAAVVGSRTSCGAVIGFGAPNVYIWGVV